MRSHYVREVSEVRGDTQHHAYAKGQFMIHELETIGHTALVFATAEFLDSANEPLKLDATADLSKVASRVSSLGPEGRASALTGVFFLFPVGRLAHFAGYPRCSPVGLMPRLRMFFRADVGIEDAAG